MSIPVSLVEQMVSLRAEGLSLREIGERCGGIRCEQVSRQRVHQLLGSTGRWLVPIDLAEAMRRYAAGASLSDVARAMGISRPTLTRRLVDAGVAIRYPPCVAVKLGRAA